MVAVITHLALGVVAVQGAVLAVRLDTGFTLEVGVQVEPTLTRVAPRAVLTGQAVRWASHALEGQLVGPLVGRAGRGTLTVLEVEVRGTFRTGGGQRGRGHD